MTLVKWQQPLSRLGDWIHPSTQVRARFQLLVLLRIPEGAFDDENTKVQIPFQSTKYA